MMTTQLIPLAWAITPGFFWAGLALASIPIIIHLLNRRRFKVVRWAAMEYLLAALRKNRRRMKFEQLLLLAVRCALLLLLGLALARPLGCTDSTIAALAGQRSGLHIFVIDNSYSMAYEAERTDARTHLDQAKKLAKRHIDQLLAGSEAVAVISAARVERNPSAAAGPTSRPAEAPADIILVRPTYDLEAAKAAIDRIEQSAGGTDLGSAFQAAIALAREQQSHPRKSLYVLTDFTRSAWEGDKAALLRQAARELTGLFEQRIRIHNLAREGQWNYAVLGVRPDGGLVRANFDAAFQADVKGFGAGPETLVRWQWDEKVLPEGGQRLRPDLGTDVQRLVRRDLQEGGAHALSVALVNDEKLKLDNTRWRVVQVADALKVLVVEGERGTEVQSGSGASLAFALAPKTQVQPDGSVRSSTYVVPEVISDLELANKVLGDYQAVILTNVGAIAAPQAEMLARFVRQGGTLMVFMGEQVNPDAYNSVMLPRKLIAGKLVARKGGAGGAKYTFEFSPTSPSLHPLLGEFRDQERTGLDTAEIQTYLQMELDPQLRAEVVLKYLAQGAAGDPAITRHALDRGFVVTVTTTANSDWNSLPPKPAYIPLIHGLLVGNVDVGDRWMNLLVGQSLQVPATLKLAAPPTLSDPAGKPVPIEAVPQDDGQTRFQSKSLDRPGLYRLAVGSRSIPVAVNVPSDEADIRTLPPDQVRHILGDIDVQMYGDTFPDALLARDDQNDLGWALMLIVLALAALECFLAMRFSHYRRRPAVAPAAAPALEVARP